ncbi:heat repeat-containing protein [Cystoisospora suis]|uniref:Heat repeat-containing protein n=1 Tax=Cystoisospora suis TaxID=483139 RepID=A0A2C6LF40_9APIC|nr:heat repeat-containing protein [Cystoisospora suis]
MPPVTTPAAQNAMASGSAPAMTEVLKALQSPDNNVRQASEAALQSSPLPQLLPALAQSVRTAPSKEDKQLAAVLVRRCLLSRWSELESGGVQDAKQLDTLLQGLLECLLQSVVSGDEEGIVKNSSVDAAAEVWRKKKTRSLEDLPCVLVGRWLAEQQPQETPETAAAWWRLVDRLCEDQEVGAFFVQRNAPAIIEKMRATLQHRQHLSQTGQNAEVAVVACLQALVTCMSRLPSSSPVLPGFFLLAPLVVGVLMPCASPGVFNLAQQLAESRPKFFSDHHRHILEIAVSVASPGADGKEGDNGEDGRLKNLELKKAALQLAVASLISAPKWAKKNLGLVKPLLEMLAECCGWVSADEELWSMKEREEEEEDEDDLSQEALLLATRVAERLNTSAVLEKLLEICRNFLASDNWRRQLAALLLLAALLEEEHSSQGVMRHADTVVDVCVSLLQRPQARLRWAALNCLCSFLQEETREGTVVTPKEIQLLTCFMEALQRETVHRCRRKALQAIAEFFSNFAGDEEDSKEMNKEVFAQLSPYIDEVLQKAVIPLCDSPDAQTQELALAVASVLAQVSGRHFTKFFSFFMGAVRNQLSMDFAQALQQDKKRHMMCFLETVVEFAGALAAAVGMEVFAPEAPWLLERLVELQRVCSMEATTAGASLQSTAMEAIGEVVRVMRAQSVPYLSSISPIVIARARQHVDCSYQEAISATGGEDAGATVSEEGRISTVNITDKSGMQTLISINTAAVEEKVAALHLLGNLAESVGPNLPAALGLEWTSVVLAECKAQFTMIRKEAYGALPSIIGSLTGSDFQQFVLCTRDALVMCCEVLDESPNPRHVTSFLLPCTTRLVENLLQDQKRKKALSSQTINQVVVQPVAASLVFQEGEERSEFLGKLFAGLGKFILPIAGKEFESLAKKEVEEDEWENVDEDEEEEQEAASEAYDAAMQCAGVLFKVYGAECLRHFHAHLKTPFGALLAHEQANPGGKVAALCIFADVINFCGEEAGEMYSSIYLPAALLAVCPPEDVLTEDDLFAVSGAAYGIGVVAVRNRTCFLSRLAGAQEALSRALKSPVLQTEEGRAAADCAACALLKVLVFYTQEIQGAGADTPSIFTELLLTWFPLREDKQEIEASADLFVDLVTANHSLVQVPAAKEQVKRVLTAMVTESPLKDSEPFYQLDKDVALQEQMRLRRVLELLS